MADTKITSGYDGLKLPYSPAAEQAVLGAVLMDADAISRIYEILPTSEYFYVSTHKLIYETMIKMFTQGKVVDYVTILETLKMDKSFDEATGKTYLISLAESCPSISNIEEYAKIVREKYEIRMLISASRDTIEDASDGEVAPEILIDSAEQRIYDIRKGRSIQGLQRLSEVLLQTFDRLDLLNKADESVKPIPTGIGDLDRVITGLNRSDLILLAARPGMGKTSFALNIAKYVSCTVKKTVAFFSLEMTKEQLASRLLASEALVSGTKLRTGKLNDEEWRRISEAGDILSKANLYLDDTPGITVSEMKAKLRRHKDVDLVIIDYLQLMSNGGRRSDNRVQEISEITRNMKILAKEINVPVICLSQLSRASEQRSDHIPQLSDLRDSGSIEQDADIVLFLYRENYYGNNDPAVQNATDIDKAICKVAKNRHGETRQIDLHWQGEFMRFTGSEGRSEE
ncbi:MAG: replicative DNA helicase [Oscillospiraceae bacterium]|nr:replicative DNA helicase [Candidatus Ruminococcus equi]